MSIYDSVVEAQEKVVHTSLIELLSDTPHNKIIDENYTIHIVYYMD